MTTTSRFDARRRGDRCSSPCARCCSSTCALTFLYAQRSGSLIVFGHAFVVQAPGWAVWGLATAPVVQLSRRFPLAGPLRLRALAAHVAACLTIALLGEVLRGLLRTSWNLEVAAGADCGVRVRLRLPYRVAPPAAAARPDA